MQDLKAIVADTLEKVRNLALGLRLSALDDLGLVPTVQRCVRTFQSRHGLAIDFQTVGLEGVRLPSAVGIALCRIVREALTNVVQHANAHQVCLLLEVRAGAVSLIVENNSQGFEVDHCMRGPAHERCLGLYEVRERAELLGGRLTIESAPGRGRRCLYRCHCARSKGDRLSSEPIRVLIADDHAMLRAGLHLLPNAQPDMVVVGEAETAEQAISLDADLQPDVVLMDLALPLRPGDPNTVPEGWRPSGASRPSDRRHGSWP